MKIFTRSLFVAFALFFAVENVAFGEDGYFSAFPELPLPPLMQENADSAVRFDQPEGRIITLQANGAVKPSQIIDFYDKALPSLGWTRHSVAAGKTSGKKFWYSRDAEVLFFEIKALNGGSSRLNVLLRPR